MSEWACRYFGQRRSSALQCSYVALQRDGWSSASAYEALTVVHLPPLGCTCSGPAVSAIHVSPTQGQAVVTSPLTGRPWSTYNLTVCEATNPTVCLSNVICPVNPGLPTTCPIPGCTPVTKYTVVAMAQKPNSPDSEQSNTANFTTPIP